MNDEIDFYSITPLGCFNASDEFSISGIKLPYCSFIKLTEEQLNEWFKRKQGDSGENTLSVGTLIPTRYERENIIKNKYFLCFSSKELHDKHLTSVGCALRLLYKFPAFTTRTYREDGASGSLEKCLAHPDLPCLQNIPEWDVPEYLKQAHQNYKKRLEDNITGEACSSEQFMQMIEWKERQYKRFYWQNGNKNDFMRLEERIKTLFLDKINDPAFRYLRFAINWYMIAQDAEYTDQRIAFSCMILELLCLKPDGYRGKVSKLANSIHKLLPGSIQEKRYVKKLMESKYYSERNNIMHGFAYDDKTLKIEECEIELIFDACRRIILFMLGKSIEEQKGKEQILRDIGIIKQKAAAPI
ncbi:MAG TPA: hypothetical protein VM658_07590 [bacterium]|nr:hypothetical protein [bacterium]